MSWRPADEPDPEILQGIKQSAESAWPGREVDVIYDSGGMLKWSPDEDKES